MKDFTLRLAEPSDLSMILDIERQSYSHPWTEGNFVDCFKPGYEVWLCLSKKNGNVSGYALLSVAAGESHLLNICVGKEYRRLGLAKYLISHLVERAKALRADVMFLEVRQSNKFAIALYEAFGFNEIGLRKGYYPLGKERENAIVMAYQFCDE